MDFFEKAHVVKKESSRKEHKSDESVKKQLKKLLIGYKQCDSKLIKHCDDKFDPNKLLDESSSVSGFSDLNLTNSSNEDDTTRGIVGSDSDDYINSEEDNVSGSSILKEVNTSESLELSNSISEYDDNIQTLSDNMTAEVTLDSISDAGGGTSLDTSLDETTSESYESEFDPDGALASKILEKLKDKGVAKKKGKKRKLDKESEYPSSLADKHKSKQPPQSSDCDNTSILSVESSNSPINTVERETSDNTMSDTNSSDFVSIAVTDMASQSLSEILGEYKHTTVRNIPESQNLHLTNCGAFSVENISVEDIQIHDDIDIEMDKMSLSDETDLNGSGPMSESTNVYDDTLQSEVTSEKDLSVLSLDSLESPIKVYYGKSNCIFLMKSFTELYIHGKATVTALKGTVEIFGYTLKGKPCEVYAPNYNYALSLRSATTDPTNLEGPLFGKLTSEGISVADVEDIVTKLGNFNSVISLKRLNNHKMDFVESMTPTDLFSKINRNVDDCLKRASEFLGCSLYLTRPLKVFEELSCGARVLELGSENQSRGIICGGKGVGKSTFLRYCVNRLLAQGPLLVIDLDPGQAEFTVAGNISATIVDQPLLGPNFTHLKRPHKMLNIGMINTMDNPRRYAAAVCNLIEHCNSDEQLKSMPWILNTMGMCNAMGLKFITQVILLTKPTYLLQINTKNPKKSFDTLLTAENVMNLLNTNFQYDSLFRKLRRPKDLAYSFFVESQTDISPKNSSLAPRDERYLNFLGYFSELFKSPQTNGLLGITPFEVNLGDLHIGLNIKINNDAVAKVINGKIIALCQLTTADKSAKVFTLQDKPLLCHGHGLIRGIDLEKEILYVVTPTPVDKLSLVDALVYADWVPELRGQERHLPDGITVPYRAATMYQKRQLMFTPRRRFNPLQLLKMSRNT